MSPLPETLMAHQKWLELEITNKYQPSRKLYVLICVFLIIWSNTTSKSINPPSNIVILGWIGQPGGWRWRGSWASLLVGMVWREWMTGVGWGGSIYTCFNAHTYTRWSDSPECGSGYLDILDIWNIIIRWMYYKLLTISDPEWWEQVKQWRPPTLCKTCSNNFANKLTFVFDVNQIKLIFSFKPHNMYLCCRENQKDKQLPSRHHSSLMLTLITSSESGNFTFFLIARFKKKTLGIRSFSTIQPDSL